MIESEADGLRFWVSRGLGSVEKGRWEAVEVNTGVFQMSAPG